MQRPTRTVPAEAIVAVALSLALVASMTAPASARPDGPRTAVIPAAVVRTAALLPYWGTIADGRIAARQLLASTGAPSMSIALVEGERIVWREGFGYANKATSYAPQQSTMYGIGSVSKMFAAVAIMRLVDQGKVSLDAPVTRYLPDFRMESPEYRQVTVRMLLDHSSGFPGTDYRGCISSVLVTDYAQQVLNTLKGSRLKTTPGLMSVYANDGFTLVESIVPAVTGKTYERFVADEITGPLGMRYSMFPTHPFADRSWAKAYDGSKAAPRETVGALASGGMYSTPTDMLRLAGMLMNGGVYGGKRVLSASSVNEMARDQVLGSFNPVPDDAYRYGLGWDTVTEAGLKAVGVPGWVKGGDSADYHASLSVAPRQRLAVMICGTRPIGSSQCEKLGQRILLRALVERKTLGRVPAPLPTPRFPAVRPTDVQLAAVCGYYGASAMLWRVRAAADRTLECALFTKEGWKTSATGLKLRTSGRFSPDARQFTTLRTVVAGGRRYLVNAVPGGNGHYVEDTIYGQKLAPADPLPEAWADRMGGSWLAANDNPGSLMTPVFRMLEASGCPGYVAALAPADAGDLQVLAPVSETRANSFVVIPLMNGRDLSDAVMEARDTGEWLNWGSYVFRPMSSVPTLPAGTSAIPFGAEGLNEWRSVTTSEPIAMDGMAAWRVYDAELNLVDSGMGEHGDTSAAKPGSYLLLYSRPGATATVTVGER